ncbi:hypothetical protein [Paenibacillus silviterrae]|uniref:hypothetical protein n=1 Tax=Paenibacillus silviterrae TaxID=3242194 RepID=UPI002542E905|nr:hypothetical protein [Paenibacillus chinjuensis]
MQEPAKAASEPAKASEPATTAPSEPLTPPKATAEPAGVPGETVSAGTGQGELHDVPRAGAGK